MKIKKILFYIIAFVVIHKTFIWLKPFGDILSEKNFSRIVYDRNDKLLRVTLTTDDKYRIFKPLDEISKEALSATLLFEDQYFYYHPGINPISLLKALYVTYIKKQRVLGASTITMQLARQIYNINSRNKSGKIVQILAALKLEFLYSKNDILEAYLNIAPYGFNIEGIEAASQIYFQKTAQQLSTAESLTLVVIPQSPYERTYNITKTNKANKKLKSAREIVYNKWLKKNNILRVSDLPIDMDIEMLSPKDLPFLAPHFVTDLLDKTNKNSLKTTIDSDMQQNFEKIIKDYIESKKHIGIENAAVLLIDSNNMEVLTSIGSADFFNDNIMGQVNGVTSRRSPGSALKPFAYALAIDQGLITPQTMLKDTPTYFGTYTPDNFDRKFSGPLSATEALINSRNVPAINIAAQISSPNLYEFLKGANIPLNESRQHYGLSIVLGTAEITMEEITKLYAIFLNDGKYLPLRKLIDQNSITGKELISKEAGFITLNMLAKNPSLKETQKKFQLDPYKVAWKTGTSISYRDAWAIGMTGQYVIAVWVGDFSGKGNPSYIGKTAAGPLLFNLIDALHNSQKVNELQLTPKYGINVKQVKLCSLSGSLPHEYCTHKITDWFIPGKSPIKKCNIHRKVTIDEKSGQLVCPSFTGKTYQKTFEFWPSDILKIFKKAGIARKLPPKLHNTCKKESYGDVAPSITSPKANIDYLLRQKGTKTNLIPLTAIADGNVETLSWYVANNFIGTSHINQPLIWEAKTGRHFIQVMDDQGRWSSVSINVELVN